jgi:hypothetical protein
MPIEENKIEDGPLSNYTSCLAFYRGEGILTLSNQQKVPCIFEIGQLRNGDIFLSCVVSHFELPFWIISGQQIECFDGETDENLHLSVVGDIIVLSYQQNQLTCRIKKLCAEIVKSSQAHMIHFGITNFVLEKEFSLNIEHNGVAKSIHIEPINQHLKVIERVKALSTVDVTCEIIGSLMEYTDIEELEQVVDNLCSLLSIAHGTKIAWIYIDSYNENKVCVSRFHGSTVTKKGYGSLSLIKGDQMVKAFIERTYSTYIKNKECYKLDIATIDTYLDAKSEYDYLQVRGIKMAVSMELIKDIFLNLSNNPINEFTINEKTFKKITSSLKGVIKPILESVGITSTEGINTGKLNDFNRKSFKILLNEIFNRIDLKIEDEDVSHFVRCRNSLVHQGRFRCETMKGATPTSKELFQEYCFLMHILDKVVLKLIGYQGIYLNRQASGQAVPSEIL